MLRWNASTLVVMLLALAAIAASSVTSGAGESLSERDELESGPFFFGTAREVGTLKPMQNVQIKAQLGTRRMLVNTNNEGRFKLPSFGLETVADDVTVSCAKEGYSQVNVSRRKMSNAADSPIAIDCLLEPKPKS
jgi:hypothetical protein